ncbi:hypothetical protein SPJ1_0422 [Streptococcus parauberis KRS-02083]|uniref:Uncharacterized protein n=1 Tax=Streptococcus parauberis KRS-02083 TaxID=1207545 RepID=A0ABP2T198_9STRE|nr:hypothetical protein SPJ1_0422 [Streptococcus parauberis KRS-02083]
MYVGYELFESVIKIPGASYLDEFYWLDIDNPNSSTRDSTL